jgi:hypothetical protein
MALRRAQPASPGGARHAGNGPALEAWWRELAAGARTPTTFDPLWRAACAEMSALDHEAAGLPTIAESFRKEARAIVRKAAMSAGAA